MTSMLCWIGRDTHAPPASIYIATDSRISWSSQNWDFGRKTYASTETADIFGYCGDVLFPSLVLSQFVSALNEGLYPRDFESRRAGLERLVRVSLKAMPRWGRGPFTILHCGRDAEKMDSVFHAATLAWRKGDWSMKRLSLPQNTSGVVHIDGIGSDAVRAAIVARSANADGGTTRGLFRSFVEALATDKVGSSGGAPQLVGLYRIRGGMSFGVLHHGKRFLYGMPVHDLAQDSDLAWHNELFERASGVTRSRLPGAQSHTA
jgi:hypothetical protein